MVLFLPSGILGRLLGYMVLRCIAHGHHHRNFNSKLFFETQMNKFDEKRYKWNGFRPRIGKAYYFCWKPKAIRGTNNVDVLFLWWRLSFFWLWNPHAIWNDGWDACFRQNMYKDEIIESTKVYNREN